MLLADLDASIQDSSVYGQTTYLVGLDIESAFDNADIVCLMGQLDASGALLVLCRLVGNWMTTRAFKVRLQAPGVQYFSKSYAQSTGAPQGGVLSPLMWLLLIILIPARVKAGLIARAPSLEFDKNYLMQIFADDISAAIRGKGPQRAAEHAHQLIEILVAALR